jgi:hypothetical protein
MIVAQLRASQFPRTSCCPRSRKDWSYSFISRANVAEFLIKQIGDDKLLRKTPVRVDGDELQFLLSNGIGRIFFQFGNKKPVIHDRV